MQTEFLAFLKEEKAQAVFEYILLLGVVIIQAVIIGALYIKIVRNAGEKAVNNVERYTEKTNAELNKWLNALSEKGSKNATKALNKTF